MFLWLSERFQKSKGGQQPGRLLPRFDAGLYPYVMFDPSKLATAFCSLEIKAVIPGWLDLA
jgi:hypothetical protein